MNKKFVVMQNQMLALALTSLSTSVTSSIKKLGSAIAVISTVRYQQAAANLSLSIIRQTLSLSFFAALFATSLSPNVLAQQVSTVKTIHFAIANMSTAQKQSYQHSVALFERENPDIHVRFVTIEGNSFNDIYNNLLVHKQPIDLISWYGGHRLHNLQAANITASFPEQLSEQIQANFSKASIESVSIDNAVHGLPISYYPWGFYYNKQLFQRLNIEPPKTWAEFVLALEKIKNEHITPIAIGLSEPWPAAAWFDYILLRNYAYEFYQQVVAGKISYESKEIQQVIAQWKLLVDNKYFTPSPKEFDGANMLPLIVRKYAGVYLVGSFAQHRVNEAVRAQLGYFPFPKIADTAQTTEIAPISILSVTNASKYKAEAFKFVRFIANPEIQQRLNNTLTTLSPIKNSTFSNNELLMMGQLSLQNADHFSQYFDRETPHIFAKVAKQAFAQFIVDGDAQRLTQTLEKARKAHY